MKSVAVNATRMVVKVVKKETPKRPTREVFALRLDPDLLDRLEELAKKHTVSRAKLIEAILKQAIDDPKFVVHLD